MNNRKKILTIIGIAVLVVASVVGLLWYYQQQGFIKVFPTAEDRRISQLLVIDKSKFTLPEGAPSDKLDQEIATLNDLKKKIQDNPSDAQSWFDFAHHKEYLNDHAGAAAAWEKAFELQPLNFITALDLGNMYQYFLKDYPKAEYYYKKSLEIHAGFTSAYEGLLDLYRYNWQGHSDKYEPTALDAVKNDSANEVSYLVGMVEFFASRGEIDKARTYLAQVRSKDSAKATELIDSYPALR